jgi:hypothetical protein
MYGGHWGGMHGAGALGAICNNGFVLHPVENIVATGGCSLLVIPAVLGGISLFVAVLAGVESWLLE